MTVNAPALAHRTAQLIDRLARVTRELQFCGGLNPAQWEALRFIARANRYSCSPGALAEFLGTTKGTVSQTLIALEAKGYVVRARGTQDRRQVGLTLTPEGRALLEHDPIVDIENAAAKMPADQGEVLLRSLTRLLHDIQARHGVKEFGVCAECTLFCVNEPAAKAEGGTCGMTGETLSVEDSGKICVNQQRAG